MAGVDPELRAFVLAHRKCAGPCRADASLPTPSGDSIRVKCGCGVEFTRWVTPELRTRICCGRRCWRSRTSTARRQLTAW